MALDAERLAAEVGSLLPNDRLHKTTYTLVAQKSCHAFASTTQVGLLQALGGEKRFAVVLFATAIHRLRLALLFGKIAGALPLRLSLLGALKHRMR